jgi:hypothetical protein
VEAIFEDASDEGALFGLGGFAFDEGSEGYDGGDGACAGWNVIRCG